MTQDRLTEGGRSIVWMAVIDSLNAHRRAGPLACCGLFLKFERWGACEAWQPGDPDDGPISEQEIQALIADIAADICKRVELALNKIDPPAPPPPTTAADKAKQRWGDAVTEPRALATTMGRPPMPAAALDEWGNRGVEVRPATDDEMREALEAGRHPETKDDAD